MRRSVGLGATCALLAFSLAGCGNGKLIGSGPTVTPTPGTPNVSYEYKVPTASSSPTGITTASDGYMYFTEQATSKIGQLTTGGAFKEFTTPTANAAPLGMVEGPNGAAWFAEPGASRIATVAPGTGVITEYPAGAGSAPQYLANGQAQNVMYFTDAGLNAIGSVTTLGFVGGPYPIPTANAGPGEIALGPDGAMWFCETTAGKIGHFNALTDTVDQEFTLPAGTTPVDIIQGPDRAMWFTENTAAGPKLGHLTTNGTFSEYPLTGGGTVAGLYLALDGNIYVADRGTNSIGRFILNTAEYKEFPIKTSGAQPSFFTTGPDSKLYFTETAANQIGQFSYF